jgi:hypothetical protein
MAIDPEPAVRRAVASDSLLPVEIVRALLADVDRDVRRAAASNEALPLEDLTRAAEDPELRHAALWNRKIPVDFLSRAATDPSKWIRMAVAMNPASPRALVAQLVEDADVAVREAAAKRLGETG